MRAIDADALEKEGWSLHRTIRVDKNTEEYQTKPLRQVPTIEPRKKGRWIDDKGNSVKIADGATNRSCWCSVCGEWLTASDEYNTKGNFCPNCGMNHGRGRMRPEDLPLKTKLVQLAEECAELAQASLKMIRAIDGDTPINEIDAREHLLEEIADVKLCADIITTKVEDKKIRAIYTRKCRRWEDRLSGG